MGTRSRLLVLTVLGGALGMAPAAPAIVRAPSPRVELPAERSPRDAQAARWIVGAKPGAAAATIARRHGATALRLSGAYTVPARAARAFARDLRRAGVLRFAEANVARQRTASFDGATEQWARGAVVAPGLAPPVFGPTLGVVDDLVDDTHPDMAGHVSFANRKPGDPVLGPHGTQVASAAAGSANGSGVTGIFPGAPVISFGVPEKFGCAESVDGILALAERKARVINLSYGSDGACYAEYEAIQQVYAAGVLVVAAVGNEFEEGNPVIYPAAWPHVLSVAALDPALGSSYFSNANVAVDISAPGEGVPVAVPPAFDTDGTADGVTVADGTSFAAPIVAGAALWLMTQRKEVSSGQAADLLRRTATDVGRPGWDTDTGFGLVNLRGALTAPVPREDPLEPNDSISLVDGRVFTNPDPPVWSGRGRRVISASVDRIEDPDDVYRIRIPGRARFKVLLRPNFGDPDLEVYDRSARSFGDPVAESVRGAGRTDSVSLTNGGRSARTAYVRVYVPRVAQVLDSSYRLEFVRLRR